MDLDARINELESELRSYKLELEDARKRQSHNFNETVRIAVLFVVFLEGSGQHRPTRIGQAAHTWHVVQTNPNTSVSQRDAESDRLAKTIEDILHLPRHSAARIVMGLATYYNIPPF